MGKSLKNYSLRLKIIQIIFLSIFLLCPSANSEKDPSKSLNKQVVTLAQQGRYSEATEIAVEVLQLREKALGKDHPSVANSLNNLAELYRVPGRYAETEPLYKQALEIFEKALGAEHPNLATTLENMAKCSRSMAKNDEAEKLESRAKRIRSKR